MSAPTLFLIDGHSQIFKAYHALQNLSTSDGTPTNAVYGFVAILHRLLKTRNPEYLVVALDTGAPTFRHERYAEYKANRTESPEDLPQQVDAIREVLAGMRVPVLELDGYEADDIIATVTRLALDAGQKVVIVSADKDLFQLVNDRVTLLRLDTDKETEYTPEAVRAKMGVPPEQIRDLLAMMGDTSDNVPGIRGIGPKGAAALLEKYGDLDTVLARTDELKGKQRENVESGRENALLSRDLVTLHDNVPLPIRIEDFKRQAPDIPRLAAVYQRLEFRRQLEELNVTAAARETDYQLVTTVEVLQAFAREAAAAGRFAFDTETDSLSGTDSSLVGISLAARPNAALYVPLGHKTAEKQLSLDEVFPVLQPLFTDPSIVKIAHHSKFDRKVLRRAGLDPGPPLFDTLLAAYLLTPDRRALGLKDLAADLLGIQMTRIEELIGSGQSQVTFADVETERALPYAAADADVTLQLAAQFEPRLAESGLRELLDTIEMPLVDVLIDMESTGVRVDLALFQDLSREMNAHLEELAGRIYGIVGRAFNLASPKQVASVLFEDLQLKPRKTKKTGYSTDVEVLEELSFEHEVPRLLLEYRQYEKLKNTYIDVLPGLAVPATGRIHTSYNQHIAATGRLSSSDPNLQNIPVRTELGRRIRAGFLPSREGYVLLAADYSQIELRVAAHITGDKVLREAFEKNLDVHTQTAAKVFGVDTRLVTAEMRDQAKVVNFGILYGMSAAGLAQRLKIPMADARKFIEDYFGAFTGVKAWIDATLEAARRDGYVMTLSGRRRHLPDINSRNFNARSAAERIAINMPIQGTSADMIKIAMIRIHHWLRDSDLHARMILQVHDELVFDLPEGELAHAERRVREIMESALPLDVPVRVECHHGINWAEAK